MISYCTFKCQAGLNWVFYNYLGSYVRSVTMMRDDISKTILISDCRHNSYNLCRCSRFHRNIQSLGAWHSYKTYLGEVLLHRKANAVICRDRQRFFHDCSNDGNDQQGEYWSCIGDGLTVRAGKCWEKFRRLNLFDVH